MYDVAIIGGGMAGMAAAARLQARGLATVVLEAHGQAGGCAGFYRRKGFAFDVGATTLVDFEPGGVGGELLESIAMPPVEGERLPGYQAWLPDRMVTLHRDPGRWKRARLETLGDSPAHHRFWNWMDRLADVFWNASRSGIKLPLQNLTDVLRACRSVGLRNLLLARYMTWTMGDALRCCGLRDDLPLAGLLGMLLEDTVHATVDRAPLINGALGITIRGAGLTRARGGMYGFWKRFVAHYRRLGGTLRVGCPVQKVIDTGTRRQSRYLVQTRRGPVEADQVVAAVPISLLLRLAPASVVTRVQRYHRRDATSQGGAVVVFLGVPEDEVAQREFTHHQLLQDYHGRLGNGNNMFISISAPNDNESAPPGFRSVMISTHCDLEEWEGLSDENYERKKQAIGERLVRFARRVYPELGENAVVNEIATPRTYERFTRRPRGAVGGVRQNVWNANQFAVPCDIGVPGFWLAGDATWPGLGTVACVLGSRLAAERVLEFHKHNGRLSAHKRLPISLEEYVSKPCLQTQSRPTRSLPSPR